MGDGRGALPCDPRRRHHLHLEAGGGRIPPDHLAGAEQRPLPGLCHGRGLLPAHRQRADAPAGKQGGRAAALVRTGEGTRLCAPHLHRPQPPRGRHRLRSLQYADQTPPQQLLLRRLGPGLLPGRGHQRSGHHHLYPGRGEDHPIHGGRKPEIHPVQHRASQTPVGRAG